MQELVCVCALSKWWKHILCIDTREGIFGTVIIKCNSPQRIANDYVVVGITNNNCSASRNTPSSTRTTTMTNVKRPRQDEITTALKCDDKIIRIQQITRRRTVANPPPPATEPTTKAKAASCEHTSRTLCWCNMCWLDPRNEAHRPKDCWKKAFVNRRIVINVWTVVAKSTTKANYLHWQTTEPNVRERLVVERSMNVGHTLRPISTRMKAVVMNRSYHSKVYWHAHQLTSHN
jgi:hypothetical protein